MPYAAQSEPVGPELCMDTHKMSTAAPHKKCVEFLTNLDANRYSISPRKTIEPLSGSFHYNNNNSKLQRHKGQALRYQIPYNYNAEEDSLDPP